MKIQDFSICSTECDSLLFFSSSYQDAVNEAINKIADRLEVNFQNMNLTLVCHRSIIEIQDKNHEPDIYDFEILEDYNPELDLESFTF